MYIIKNGRAIPVYFILRLFAYVGYILYGGTKAQTDINKHKRMETEGKPM